MKRLGQVYRLWSTCASDIEHAALNYFCNDPTSQSRFRREHCNPVGFASSGSLAAGAVAISRPIGRCPLCADLGAG